MSKVEKLNKLKNEFQIYNKNISLIGNVLQACQANDKKFLMTEKNILQSRIVIIIKMLKKSIKSDEIVQEYIYNFCKEYFNSLKEEFDDFLTILQWSNFGELKEKLFFIINKDPLFSPLPKNGTLGFYHK